jgi:3',5'-cyclic AMP phosphodiesterase CpdA
MSTFLHLSDLHIGQPGALQAFTAMVDHMIAVEPPSSVPVITGDCTDNASLQECLQLASQMQRLYDAFRQVVVVPGNHDSARKGLGFSLQRYRTFHEIGLVAPVPEYPIYRDFDDCRVIWLDSCRPVAIRRWSVARGKIGRTQLHRLRMLLEHDKPCIVPLHHHPKFRGFALELIDADSLAATLEYCEAPRVVCMFGHKHQAGSWKVGKVQYIASCKSTATNRYRRVVADSQGQVSMRWVYVP